MKCLFCGTEGGVLNNLVIYVNETIGDSYLAECEICSLYFQMGDKRFKWQS